jgi:hypothetical protein
MVVTTKQKVGHQQGLDDKSSSSPPSLNDNDDVEARDEESTDDRSKEATQEDQNPANVHTNTLVNGTTTMIDESSGKTELSTPPREVVTGTEMLVTSASSNDDATTLTKSSKTTLHSTTKDDSPGARVETPIPRGHSPWLLMSPEQGMDDHPRGQFNPSPAKGVRFKLNSFSECLLPLLTTLS